MHPGDRQSWKSLWDPRTVSNSARNEPESTKTTSVDDQHVNAPQGSLIVEITSDPKIVSNSPRNGPESAKTASVDDRHITAPWGSTTMEIASGPQNGEYYSTKRVRIVQNYECSRRTRKRTPGIVDRGNSSGSPKR